MEAEVYRAGDAIVVVNEDAKSDAVLKAISQGATDVDSIRKMAGLKHTAEVYMAIDRLSLRREFHASLAKHGLTMDYIVSSLKGLCDDSDGKLKLDVLTTIIKALGLTKHDETTEASAKSWEETILEKVTDTTERVGEDGKVRYEVDVPDVPEDIAEVHRIQDQEGREVYE